MEAVNKLISVVNGQIGYLEKATNANLDDFTANAGYNNFTKYARDMKKAGAYNVQGCAWCDCFTDWSMVQTVGIEMAKKLLGGWSAYTPTSAQYYKNMGRYIKRGEGRPQAGDQIFFCNSKRICHTGWVVEVSGNTVYTVEGNTSNSAGVIANGGCVCKKRYDINNSRIDGYGRPDWASVEDVSLADARDALRQALGIVDGDCSLSDARDTLRKALGITVEGTVDTHIVKSADKCYLSMGDKGEEVKELQKSLNKVMEVGLEVDGIFGKLTRQALISFQHKYGLEADGLYGKNSRAKMAEVLSNALATAKKATGGKEVVRAGQQHANNFAGAGLVCDGVRGTRTAKAGVKVLQTAINLDYHAGLVVDGEFGAKSNAALGKHYVKLGEKQYMVTALEILLMLKGYNPNGVECPGVFGNWLYNAVIAFQKDHGLTVDGIAGAATFKALIA